MTIRLAFILTVGLLLTSSHFSFGQHKPTMRQLLKLIKSNIPTDKEASETGFRYWTVCNQDSAYFKADTIKLFNDFHYFDQISTCCQFIQLAIYKNNRFFIREGQICNEPTTAKYSSDNYQFYIFKKTNKIYFRITKSNSEIAKFEIIQIDNVKLADEMSTDVIVMRRSS